VSRDFGKIATAKQAGIELENRCEAEKPGIATSPEQGADLMASATCLYRYKKKNFNLDTEGTVHHQLFD